MSKTSVMLAKMRKYDSCIYVNDIYRLITEREHGSMSYNLCDRVATNALFISRIIASAIILIFNIFVTKVIDYNEEIAFARVPRTEVKLKRFKEDVQIISDDIYNRDFSIYQVGDLRSRLLFLLFDYGRQCISDYGDIYRMTLEKEIAPFRKIILREMTKRIPHTVVYRHSIETILKNYELDVVFTGQMYDRYALIEDELSKRYTKRLVCIPHGVESTLEMPVGYVGQEFYCTSHQMCVKLRLLYKSPKYIYSHNIAERLFRVQTKRLAGDRKFVYFTQPVNQDKTKRIIEYIGSYLDTRNETLYLKLHPLDNKRYYDGCDVELITDFEEAICDNVCISVNSTVLLESLYNDSVAISTIMLVERDQYFAGNYEFLNDTRILKPRNEHELVRILGDF